jgi:plastocyanin domain-containing protein
MKNTIIAISIALVFIALAFIIKGGENNNQINKQEQEPVNNVSIVDGIQIIEITAKGGYIPRKSIAQANIPTILRFNTKGTFDCSSSVRIPSMNISKLLPQSGVTDIDLSVQNTGTLSGTCGMGMYPFEIEFIE